MIMQQSTHHCVHVWTDRVCYTLKEFPGNLKPKAFDKVSLMKFIKRVNVERSTRASGTVQGVMH